MIPGKSAEAGVALHTDTGMENGYFLRMDLSGHTAAWDMWPRSVQGAYQWQIKGDVPCQVETSRKLPASDTVSYTHLDVYKRQAASRERQEDKSKDNWLQDLNPDQKRMLGELLKEFIS